MAEKKIHGREFQVGTILATDAIRLQVRIGQVVGKAADQLPAILGGLGEAQGSEARAASDGAALAAIGDVLANSDPDQLVGLLSDLVALARMKRPSGVWEDVDLDTDLSDSKKTILPLAAFVVKEVFADFFTDALAAMNRGAGAGGS